MNRAHQIMTEWEARVAEQGRQAQQIAELRRKLADKTCLATQLRRQVDAAATVIAVLHHDNLALRRQLDRHGPVVDLDARRPRP